MGLAIGANWLLPLALTGTGVDAAVPEAPPEQAAAAPVEAPAPAFDDIQFQVQVRQRVMIRITPLSRVSPPPPVAPRSEAPRRRVVDDEPRQCIPLADVAGVKLGQGRTLHLYMRDRRVISTLLERSCQVSSFYSGFYVERPADGMLCAGREALHARSGADCQLSAFREVGGD